MRDSFFCHILVAVLFCWMATCNSVTNGATVDFEQFNIGDDLATVNAALEPLGIYLDATFPDSFEVVYDPRDASNKVIRVMRSLTADILLNSRVPIEQISGEVSTDPNQVTPDGEPLPAVFLNVYSANQVASALVSSEHEFGIGRFSATGFLSIHRSDLFSTPGLILAATFDSGGGVTSNTYLDNVTFTLVPEPTTATLALAALCLVGIRHR